MEGKKALLTWHDSLGVLTRTPSQLTQAMPGAIYTDIKCLFADSLQSCKIQEIYIGQITASTGRLYLFNCAPVLVTGQPSIN